MGEPFLDLLSEFFEGPIPKRAIYGTSGAEATSPGAPPIHLNQGHIVELGVRGE
jgi:hypothetical protein